MRHNFNKVLFTIVDILFVIIADFWIFWLLVYYSQSIDGGVYISSEYGIFERNYIVPI